jgi:hypothetical protein
LWKKGCVQDKVAATKAKKLKLKRARREAKGHSGSSSSGDSSDGSDCDAPKAPSDAIFTVQGEKKAAVPLTRTGRFNGRIHATPMDGSCGPSALREALEHLAQTHGYQFSIPVDADDMRRVLVADITENLTIPGSNPESYTLEQEIKAEYFPGDLLPEERRGIFCPDLDEEHYLLVESVKDYLEIMSLRRTHIDEFMLGAFARTWGVRLAVIRAHGKGLTTEHSQFIAPDEPVSAERTVFLYRSGPHFEWAHENAAPCRDPLCRTRNRRISASHTPAYMPPTSVQTRPADLQPERVVVTPAPVGSRPSRGSEGDLIVLIEQLTEEYPGLSPERAEAALKLTKQNGRYNLYAAAAVLPGREGAPIVPESPSLSGHSDGQGKQDAASSVHFTDSTDETNTDDKDGCCDDAEKEHHSKTSSEGEEAAVNARVAARAQGSRAQEQGQRQEDVNVPCRSGGGCGHDRKMDNASQGVVRGHIPYRSELHQASQRRGTDNLETEERRAIRMAAQVISIAANRTLAESLEALQRHVVTHGDLPVATQHACRELMDGPRQPQSAAKVNDFPDSEGVALIERQLGRGACTPTVKALAKRSREESTGSPLQQKRLFDDLLKTQMQNAGSNLTAAQRLSTSVRRANSSLWRQALDHRYSTTARDQEEQDGNSPGNASLHGHQIVCTTATESAAEAGPAITPRAAATHASPGVRIAEQMRLKRELAASAPQGQSTVVVVSSSGNKLPTWRPGAEIDGRGFNWKTKQKMIHAWEQYQLSEGLHAPKTFKSMIDADLVPLICAECNLEEGDWEVLDDVVLLSAIEERLRPHDSMDFTVQLKQITFSNDAAAGTLTQRYRLFAEAFLAKVSEAKAAGCALQENVVKIAFSRAVSTCAILQGWLEQQKWVSASETHRRITNHLKMVDAYQALSGMGSGNSEKQGQPITASSRQQPQILQQQQGQQQQMQHQHPPRSIVRHQHQQQQFNHQISSAVNAALTAYQQAELRRQASGPAVPCHHAAGGASVNAMSVQTQLALPPFPGLDGRGLSWHVCSPLLECRCSPCTGRFCQACGVHGHTVENCRKRLFKNPGANLSGYWSEQQVGRGPMRMPAPVQGAPSFAGDTGHKVAGFTPVSQQPAFPTPYRMATGGGAVHHTSSQRPVQQPIDQATVNNTAQRSGGKVTFQESQQPDASDKSTHEGPRQQ